MSYWLDYATVAQESHSFAGCGCGRARGQQAASRQHKLPKQQDQAPCSTHLRNFDSKALLSYPEIPRLQFGIEKNATHIASSVAGLKVEGVKSRLG